MKVTAPRLTPKSFSQGVTNAPNEKRTPWAARRVTKHKAKTTQA